LYLESSSKEDGPASSITGSQIALYSRQTSNTHHVTDGSAGDDVYWKSERMAKIAVEQRQQFATI
jgi:hypothetical protein